MTEIFTRHPSEASGLTAPAAAYRCVVEVRDATDQVILYDDTAAL